jgi:hypothetical protein
MFGKTKASLLRQKPGFQAKSFAAYLLVSRDPQNLTPKPNFFLNIFYQLYGGPFHLITGW